jgi:hypothetical protein
VPHLQVARLEALLEAQKLQAAFSEQRMQCSLGAERATVDRLRSSRDDAFRERFATGIARNSARTLDCWMASSNTDFRPDGAMHINEACAGSATPRFDKGTQHGKGWPTLQRA